MGDSLGDSLDDSLGASLDDSLAYRRVLEWVVSLVYRLDVEWGDPLDAE